MFLLFVVTIPWAKLKLVYPTIQIYKTRCMVFSLLCYNISFTQHSSQDLFSVCQNVSTATHTFIKTEWSNFIKEGSLLGGEFFLVGMGWGNEQTFGWWRGGSPPIHPVGKTLGCRIINCLFPLQQPLKDKTCFPIKKQH